MASADRLPPPTGPIRIRQARREDAVAIATAAVAIWRQVYAGILPRPALMGLRPQRWAARFAGPRGGAVGVYLAERDAAGIVGYGVCGTAGRDLGGARGEIFELYVAPDAQGQGVGRRLMTAMAAFLQMRDLEPVGVWVLQDNPRAFGFYERLGGVRCGRGVTTFGGARYGLVGYRFDDLDRLMGLPTIGPAVAGARRA